MRYVYFNRGWNFFNPASIPRRYIRRYPKRHKSDRGAPCTDEWITLMDCYVEADFSNKKCLEPFTTFLKCSKKAEKTKGQTDQYNLFVGNGFRSRYLKGRGTHMDIKSPG